MPTEIYKTYYVYTFDNEEIEIIPLKIKFLKQLMNTFELAKESTSEEETINILSECVRIAMKQYAPKQFKTLEDVQDGFDLATIYDILHFSAGINMDNREDKEVQKQIDSNTEATNWDSLDLAKLETEIFTLGIWKNFDELESSISMEELMQILSITRELDYNEKKFIAALQGVDLDKHTDNDRGQKEWENLKAKVASNGAATDSKDILALQGQNAKQAGFGIGLGLGYEDLRDPSVLK